MNKNELLSSIHKGIFKANEKLSEWTGGYFLTEIAAEGFAVTHIMQEIMRHPNKPAFLDPEARISVLKRNSGRSHKGRPCPMTGGGQRIDIATYNGKGQLKYAIEVKCARPWQESYLEDIERLIKLQKEFSKKHSETNMEAGIFTLTIHSYSSGGLKKAEDTLQKKIDKWQYKIHEYLTKKHKNIKVGFNRSEKFSKWSIPNSNEVHILTSLCVIIKI